VVRRLTARSASIFLVSLVGLGLLVGDRQFLLDAVFGFVLQRGLFDLRRLRARRGRLVGDLALLRQLGLALGALDGQRGLPGDQILLRDRDLGTRRGLGIIFVIRRCTCK
jgi:hypothetical protein